MKISSVCRSGRSCSCHQPCAGGITPGQRLCVRVWVCSSLFAYAWVHEHVNSYSVHAYTAVAHVSLRAISTFAPPPGVCVRVPVCVARPTCTAGWPGKTCLSVCGTSLASLSPQGPLLCPEAGRLGGGQARRAVPKLSLFITATETGRGRQVARPLVLTYCDHLLLLCVCVSVHLCGCVSVSENEKESEEKPISYVFEKGGAYFMFDL